MKISLKNNKGFSWFSNKTTSVKGYFFDDKNNFYEKEKSVSFFENIQDENQFIEILKTINGVFSVIIQLEESVFIASDTTRSFPLFYTFKNEEYIISDDILHLKNSLSIDEFDEFSEFEFKSCLHTTGRKTLLKNVFQTQSNEYLIFKNNKFIKSDFFFSYAIKETSNSEYSLLKEKAIEAFENSFERLLKSVKNETLVIPLSGGFDSRLIAVMLKKHNYKNVVCFTYGNKNSFEIENSKKTAETLGFKWFFIEYNEELIGDYLETETFKKYAHFAGKYSSMPYLQEYFAVKHLKEKNIIPDNSIFIPGFSGDFLGGSQFLKVIPNNLKTTEIIDLIIREKYKFKKGSTSKKAELKEKIHQSLLQFDKNYEEKIPSSVFEDYDLKEKITKFNFNSASYYLFFGFEFRFPFWDLELLNFFKKLPESHKKMKLLFDEVLIENYFKPHQVFFESELQPSKKIISNQKVKDKIKPYLPTSIKQKLLEKSDWINYHLITQKMVNSMKENNLVIKKNIKTYNEIIIQWYMYLSKGKIK